MRPSFWARQVRVLPRETQGLLASRSTGDLAEKQEALLYIADFLLAFDIEKIPTDCTTLINELKFLICPIKIQKKSKV